MNMNESINRKSAVASTAKNSEMRDSISFVEKFLKIKLCKKCLILYSLEFICSRL